MTTISGPYSAATATILNDGPTVHFTGPVSSVGSDLDVDYQATADFSPATPATLTVTTLTVTSVLDRHRQLRRQRPVRLEL